MSGQPSSLTRARHDGVELTGDNGLLDGAGAPGAPDRFGGRDDRSSRRRASRGRGPQLGQQPQRVVSEDGDDRKSARSGLTCPVIATPASNRRRSRRVNDARRAPCRGTSSRSTRRDDDRRTFKRIWLRLTTRASRRDTISRITDAVLDDMQVWQARPLDRRVSGDLDRRDRRQDPRRPVANRPIYSRGRWASTWRARRDASGTVGLAEPAAQGAKSFPVACWASYVTAYIQDSFIVCCDGLEGLPESPPG